MPNASNSSKGFPLNLPSPLKPPNIHNLDHQIHLCNGSTTILELSRSRLQRAKHSHPLSMRASVDELAKEISGLRCEIQFYRECFEILQRLRGTVHDIYQQFFLAHYREHDSTHLNELIHQLHQALKESMQREARSEKSWMDFWGAKTDRNNEGDLI